MAATCVNHIDFSEKIILIIVVFFLNYFIENIEERKKRPDFFPISKTDF